ncbi:MAG: hypothetical protein F4130_12730 [Acidobacteria bacterium]|nr:hypothetical protein [Acidobacteriota bacterium]
MLPPKRIQELLARARRAPVHLLPAEAGYRAYRAGVLAGRRLRDAQRSTYANAGSPVTDLRTFAPRLDPWRVADRAPDLPDRCVRYLEQGFDLLGSGWRTVVHGTACEGFEGSRYEAPAVTTDPAGDWLTGQVTGPNLAAARAVWRLIGPGYRPIDWHLDFRCGYRWSPLTWHGAVPYGHLPGVDVKVPWELARMQHLPQLALAFGCARAGLPRFLPAERYRDAFRNQVLDFVATNPPRYGVNWHTTMEVAIRVANWLLAYDLFRSYGADWDRDFTQIFIRSVVEHGRHIAANPERSPAWRNNHYLANLVGLAFAGAYLGPWPEAERWRRTAAAGLPAEIGRQFLRDGGHFEASTGYHAFAVELAAYGLAMVRAGRRNAAGTADGLPDRLRDTLSGAGEFLICLTKPDGRLAQIGDHDSGRLFRLLPRPRFRPNAGFDGAPPPAPDEEHLDAGPAVAALGGLLGRGVFGRWSSGRLEAVLAARLAGQRNHSRNNVASPGATPTPDESERRFEALRERLRGTPAVESSRLRLAAPGGSLLSGMKVRAHSDFGLYVFRSDRLFLALRAGFVRHDGRGGHAHVDQLGLEVAIDTVSWIQDPGSYVYTARPDLRNAYRSSAAHFVPYALEGESVLWRRGLFDLDLDVRVREMAVCPGGAALELVLEGARIGQALTIGHQAIIVETRILERPEGGRARVRCKLRPADNLVFQGAPLAGGISFAPGYGVREPRTGCPS